MPDKQPVAPVPPVVPVTPVVPVPAQVQAAGNQADALLHGQPGGEVPPGGPGAADGNWQHKYDVLQGKYNAELPQLNQTNSYLTSELLTTKTLVHDLQQKLSGMQAKPPETPAATSLNLSEFLSDDQKKKLDEEGVTGEVLNMLGQAMSGATNQQFTNQATSFQHDIQTLKGDAAKTAKMTFWSTFDAAVPDSKALNVNPAFMEFMKVSVPGTGMTRQQLVEVAVQNLDPQSAIAIYNEFKSAVSPNLPPIPPTPPTPPGPGPEFQPGGLMAQADPAASLNVPGQPTIPVADTKIYTKAEVNDFFKNLAIGKFDNLPDKGSAYEALLMAACKEGRVEGSLQPTR